MLKRSVKQKPGNTTNDAGADGGTATKTDQTKTVYFYKDGDPKFTGVKVAINPRKYRSFETLLDEVSKKIPTGLGGVRSIYTPKGRTNIRSLNQLSDHGRYVCSSGLKAKGLDVSKVPAAPVWQVSGTAKLNEISRSKPHANGYLKTEPLSGMEVGKVKNATSNDSIPHLKGGKKPIPPIDKKQLSKTSTRESSKSASQNGPAVTSPPNPSMTSNVPKKLTVVRNGDPLTKHRLLLNKKTAQTYEQLLSDLGGMFGEPIKKLYTVDGKKVGGFNLSSYTFKKLRKGV